MSKEAGEEIIDKYVTKTKEKTEEPAHVGGGLLPDEDPTDTPSKLNKHGIDGMRDY